VPSRELWDSGEFAYLRLKVATNSPLRIDTLHGAVNWRDSRSEPRRRHRYQTAN
jgi:hypothetical protein